MLHQPIYITTTLSQQQVFEMLDKVAPSTLLFYKVQTFIYKATTLTAVQNLYLHSETITSWD